MLHFELEDILPVSPLQEGLLFHALYDTEGPDVYTTQLIFALEGCVDEPSLKAAAQALLQRHANLRAGFRHEGLKQPVQIIPKEVLLLWHRMDLSSLERHEQRRHLEEWLEEDRRHRFDVASPPLLRFTLIRLDEEQYQLVLTVHHILMDGWSMPVLVRELFGLYERKGDAGSLPRVTPYRDYLA